MFITKSNGLRHAHLYVVPALLATVILFTGTSQAEEVLTLEQAQQAAQLRSHQLVAQAAAVSSAQDLSVAAAQLPDPVLRLGFDNIPVTGDERFSLSRDFMTMSRVGIMQEVTRADKRRLAGERYLLVSEKALAQKDLVVAATQRATAVAWLERYYLEKVAALLAQQERQRRLEVTAVESAYRAGQASQADIFAAQSALARVTDRTSEIARKVRSAKITLVRWVGDVGQRPLGELPKMDNIRWPVADLEEHLRTHPDIIAMTKQEQIAQTEAQLAEANRRANWSWELAYQQRGESFSNMMSVGVSLPLQWNQKHLQDRDLAAKLAQLDEARAERDEMLRDHVAEVAVMIDEWQNTRERQQRYQNELLPLDKSRTEAVLAAWRGGKSNLTEVIVVQRDALETQLQALQLELDSARLWAQINFILPDGSVAVSDTKPLFAIKE